MDPLTNYIEMQEAQLQNEKLRRMQVENEIGEISSYKSKEEINLVKYQLELTDELEIIFHLLQGQYLGYNERGDQVWKEPEDDRLRIFSNYGIRRIMNLLSMYVTKNKLLAYYDAETIKWKMRDFGIELTDLFNNAYELLFYYPTPEELFEKYLYLINKNNLNITEKELYEKCIQWSDEELQQKIINIPIIIQAIMDFVDDAYHRALNGQERKSLRERINISQQASQIGQFQPQKSEGIKLFNPRTW